MKNLSLWGKPVAEANQVNHYMSGDACDFKQDEDVPMDTSHKLYMEAITPSGKYFFTDLSCYSTWWCEKLNDKWYGCSDITHQSESSHSHACTTAMPVKVYGLDTWKKAWMEEVCISGEQHYSWLRNTHWENELYFGLHPKFAYLYGNVSLTVKHLHHLGIEILLPTWKKHGKSVWVGASCLSYICNAPRSVGKVPPEAFTKGAWNISENVIPEVIFIQIFRFLIGFTIARHDSCTD